MFTGRCRQRPGRRKRPQGHRDLRAGAAAEGVPEDSAQVRAPETLVRNDYTCLSCMPCDVRSSTRDIFYKKHREI